jgi:hypothetical protein
LCVREGIKVVAWKKEPKNVGPPKSNPNKHTVHNDHGKAVESGGKLYTYCTCGKLQAVDKLDDE